MTNTIAQSPAKLIPQITLVIPGVTSYGAILGMPAGLETVMAAKKAALVFKDEAYEQARLDRKAAYNAKTLAFKKGRSHLRTVREILRPMLTSSYSQSWDAFGFTGSLALPRTISGVILALTKLASHLTANPALGEDEPNLVAAKAVTLESTLSTTVATLNVKKADVQRLHEARLEAAQDVRILVREVLGRLHLKLDPLDSRWVEFGFNKPGAQPTPGVPEGLTAVQMGANALLAKWSTVPRAGYYRMWKRVIGVDPELVALGTTPELDFLLEQVPANSLIELALSAGNNSGESIQSAVFTIQTA